MANLYDRLVAAGAPEITAPRFYRVRDEFAPDGPGSGGFTVELRETYPDGIGSKKLQSMTVYPPRGSTPQTLIVNACVRLVELQRQHEAFEEYLGNHSPSEG